MRSDQVYQALDQCYYQQLLHHHVHVAPGAVYHPISQPADSPGGLWMTSCPLVLQVVPRRRGSYHYASHVSLLGLSPVSDLSAVRDGRRRDIRCDILGCFLSVLSYLSLSVRVPLSLSVSLCGPSYLSQSVGGLGPISVIFPLSCSPPPPSAGPYHASHWSDVSPADCRLAPYWMSDAGRVLVGLKKLRPFHQLQRLQMNRFPPAILQTKQTLNCFHQFTV